MNRLLTGMMFLTSFAHAWAALPEEGLADNWITEDHLTRKWMGRRGADLPPVTLAAVML